MIKFENVSKTYEKKHHSVYDISFHIKKGECVSLVGPSGAGKTTIIKLLLAEEKPTDGHIYFNGINVHNLRKSHIPSYRQKLGVVFQDFKLLSEKTAYENVAFAMEMVGKSDDEIRADVPHALGLVGLSEKMFHFPNQLSGGEKQRLAIARAIINQPELLLADEPIASLDKNSAHQIINILKKINELGTTVVLSTHNSAVGESMHGRVITLEKGHIINDENVSHHKK